MKKTAPNYFTNSRQAHVEIEDILSNNAEVLELPEETAEIPEHDNIRGREYYK